MQVCPPPHITSTIDHTRRDIETIVSFRHPPSPTRNYHQAISMYLSLCKHAHIDRIDHMVHIGTTEVCRIEGKRACHSSMEVQNPKPRTAAVRHTRRTPDSNRSKICECRRTKVVPRESRFEPRTAIQNWYCKNCHAYLKLLDYHFKNKLVILVETSKLFQRSPNIKLWHVLDVNVAVVNFGALQPVELCLCTVVWFCLYNLFSVILFLVIACGPALSLPCRGVYGNHRRWSFTYSAQTFTGPAVLQPL